MPGKIVLIVIAALLTGAWSGWFAHTHLAREAKAIDPMRVATEYAATNYPPGTFQPRRAGLMYIIADHGDLWIVELGPQGFVGGGLRLMVRKRDGKVLHAIRTQ